MDTNTTSADRANIETLRRVERANTLATFLGVLALLVSAWTGDLGQTLFCAACFLCVQVLNTSARATAESALRA